MKLSVSLPDDDVAFIDRYVRRSGAATRSAALRQAIELLRAAELEDSYAEAFDEWHESGDAAAWDVTVADGDPGAEAR
ncbi:ribbon-helix-helix domain-containing protein [Thermocrispum municipale]|jgi:Arc/MetJ-type ribon-helix-helix transcriptional regulator|uniref:ribbon-helix-helix domain-containing protein n=1 Tax=Thermocrispum municipale TaxID=37926 RepID=UPI00041C0189|nr:ribbon-helix-helix domain-containing protein [Thermocrispum municipale]